VFATGLTLGCTHLFCSLYSSFAHEAAFQDFMERNKLDWRNVSFALRSGSASAGKGVSACFRVSPAISVFTAPIKVPEGRRLGLVRGDVSGESVASIIRVKGINELGQF
jgi:hypothetical protein